MGDSSQFETSTLPLDAERSSSRRPSTTPSRPLRRENGAPAPSAKIVYLLPYPRFFSQIAHMGGHVAHLCGVIGAFENLGHEVELILEEDSPTLSGLHARSHVLPLKKASLPTRILWGRRLVRETARVVEGCRPKLLYMRYSVGFSNWMPQLKKAIGDTPLVVEINSFLAQRSPWAAAIERRCIGAADHVVTISETNRRQIEEMYPGKRMPFELQVVPNGVNTERFSDWEENMHRSYGQEIRMGYAGIIKKDYGLEVLIEATRLARVQEPRLELHVYGDGPHREALEASARGESGIQFHGPQSFDKMPEILGGLDILLNAACKLNAFQSPTKVYEYMATGRPIISARTEHTRRLLEESGCGLCHELEDARDLAAKMVHLVRNPELGAGLALKARHEVSSRHSWEQRVTSILESLEAGRT